MRNSRAQGVLGTLFAYEIRMLLRDTRTILIAVVAPLIIFPTYILVTGKTFEQGKGSRPLQAIAEIALPDLQLANELIHKGLRRRRSKGSDSDPRRGS